MSQKIKERKHNDNVNMYYLLHCTLSWESESNLSNLNASVFENYLHKLLYSKNRNVYRKLEKHPNSFNKNKAIVGRKEVSTGSKRFKQEYDTGTINKRYNMISSQDRKSSSPAYHVYSTESSENIKKENIYFPCDTCSNTYSSKASLKRHKLSHYDERDNTDDQCEKKPTHNYSLKGPKLFHTCDKSFTCDICDNKSMYTSQLKKYKYTQNTDNKQFMCQTCGKHFNHSSSLSRHRLTHTDNKRFFCDVCGKTFTQGSSLKTHQYIHTGEKPFNCKLCGKRFNSNSNLKAHLITHSGKRTR